MATLFERTPVTRTSDLLRDADPARVNACDSVLNDPVRLSALRRTGLMDTPREPAFDRLANLAAKILHVPLTIISLVGHDKQFFKAGFGLPPPYDTVREIPVEGSICRYTLSGEPIIVDDVLTDPFLMNHPATRPWGLGTFVALPMRTDEGHVLGAFCAAGFEKRHWSADEISIFNDLVFSVMTEIRLREQVAELQKQRDIRERLVATITHDLRSPITAALLNAQRLVRASQGDAKQNVAAERIAKSMAHADGMIRDLLDASRLQAGEQLPLKRQACNFVAVVRDTIGELTNVHGDRFQVEVPSDAVAFYGDVGAVQRVLENMASNAVKYGDPAAPITVRVERENDATQIALSVYNEGPVIPPEECAHVFEAYYRAAAAARGSRLGWGLGLGLVRALVEAHGGAVTVTSSSEAGTMFSARFPCNRK